MSNPRALRNLGRASSSILLALLSCSEKSDGGSPGPQAGTSSAQGGSGPLGGTSTGGVTGGTQATGGSPSTGGTSPSTGGAGRAGAQLGSPPAPGGWNRFQLEVADLDAEVARLRGAGASFRGSVAQGAGGRQILVEDPSGNPVELFEPAAR